MPVEILVGSGSAPLHGRAKDISVGGMFVETTDPVPFGAPVVVVFASPTRHAVHLPGVVRWTCATGVGVQFGLLGAVETHAITEIQRVA